MNSHRIIFSFVLLLAAPVTNAQGGATIKATTDKNRILIGEPLQLTIEARLSPGSVISFVNIDTIPHFELLGKPVIDTLTANGETTIKGIYPVTSFDSGHWVIPSFILSKGAKTDTIPVDVVFSEFNPSQDYHDIKGIIEVIPPKKKQTWWYIAGGALLLAAALVYFLGKKKPALPPAPKMIEDPYKEAMKQLELLQKEKPEAKKYHSGLTDIFRLYIFRKKGILSLQKTTADLVLQLSNLPFNKEQSDKLSQALRLSDFVKFAKYVPTGDDDRNCFEEIKNAIMTIEKSEAKVLPEGRT